MSATTRSALAATVLAVPVLAEIAWPARLDAAGGLLLFAASQLVGWALLASLVLGAPPAARSRVTARPARRPRGLCPAGLVRHGLRRYSLRRRSPRGLIRTVHARLHHSPRGRASVGLTTAAQDRWPARRRGTARSCRPWRPGDDRRQRPVPRRLPRVVLRRLGRCRARLRHSPRRLTSRDGNITAPASSRHESGMTDSASERATSHRP